MTHQLDFSELPPKSFCCERSTINQEWPLKAFFLVFVCPQNMWMALSFDVGGPQQSYLSRTLVIDWRKLNSFGKRFYKSPKKGPEIRIPISLLGNFPAIPSYLWDTLIRYVLYSLRKSWMIQILLFFHQLLNVVNGMAPIGFRWMIWMNRLWKMCLMCTFLNMVVRWWRRDRWH